MKLGIITFHRAINYGAVLQAYALNKATKELGYQSEVINYRYNKIDNGYILFSSKSLKRKLSDLYYYPIKSVKIKKFQDFINSNIDLSKETYKNTDELKKSNNVYDIYLTGSDQVFNLNMTGDDKNYFLDFVNENSKKNSYAASFGQKQIPEDKKNMYIELLNKFNNISVREKDAIGMVENLLGKKPRIDVDPSFLLSKEQWKDISVAPKEKNKYIVLFVMQKNKTIFNFAEELSKKTGYEIIFITDGYKKLLKAKHKKTVSPQEWLGYFLNAEYIITNSFHGLAFAINFNKKFFVELQKPPAPGNSRLETLLEEYDLKNRLIKDGKCDYIEEEIDWNIVNKKLKENKQKSLEYLKGLKNE